MTEEIRKKIAAIYELVKRGVDGEKDAAKLALDRLMKKYDVDPHMLETIEFNTYAFKYSSNLEMYLIAQLVEFFLGGHVLEGATRDTWHARDIKIDLLYPDYITIDCAYEYFRRHMKKQWDIHCAPELKRLRSAKKIKARREKLQKVFFGRYVIESGLYKEGDLTAVDTSKMTQQQIDDFRRLRSVEGGQYNKQMITGNLLGA